MNHLEALRKANPEKTIYAVTDREFLKYGKVLDVDTSVFCEKVKAHAVMPEAGSLYVPVFEPIEHTETAEEYREMLCAGLDEQWGLCWGYNSKMTALEWHTCNEFNIGVTELVLILGKREDIDADGRYDANKCVFFYVPEGVMIETYADTLHYGPCMVTPDGFSLVVGLQRGTNTEFTGKRPENPMITARNKWLIAHESEKTLIEGGALGWVYGPNWTLKTVS